MYPPGRLSSVSPRGSSTAERGTTPRRLAGRPGGASRPDVEVPQQEHNREPGESEAEGQADLEECEQGERADLMDLGEGDDELEEDIRLDQDKEPGHGDHDHQRGEPHQITQVRKEVTAERRQAKPVSSRISRTNFLSERGPSNRSILTSVVGAEGSFAAWRRPSSPR